MSTAYCAAPLLIRHARMEDAAALHAACFPEMALDDVEAYLEWCLAVPTRPLRLIAFWGERLVGHVELTLRHNGQWVELSSLVVAYDAQKQGVGRRLVAAAVRAAQRWGSHELRLQVEAQRTTLIAMYRRWGFQLQGPILYGRRWLAIEVPQPTLERLNV